MEAKKDAIRSRKPFTPGWTDDWDGAEGLPIKKGGKLIRVRKEKTSSKAGDEEEDGVKIIDDEAEEEEKLQEKIQKRKEHKPKEKVVLVMKSHKAKEAAEIQQNIADICTGITSNPEAALLKKNASGETGLEKNMKDLFELMESTADVQELEWAMLSAALVFKDICPSYRIRADEEDPIENGQQLKKETKKLRDFELNLLKAYHRFLKFLDSKAQTGLGSVKNQIQNWGLEQQIGFVAVKCQCELIKTLNQFNFRSELLSAVAGRACQDHIDVSTFCCQTLHHILAHDIHCDLSYEFVAALNKILTATKYSIPERLLQCLQSIRLTVHEDKVKALQLHIKSERKKRKRNHDTVESMMLEANAEADKLSRQRFQGNALQDIALIYFRILKAKVGFKLLPVALEGLGKITHLINLDTVNDLLTCLKHLLSLDNTPVEVRLLCVHCAMSTLSGPGQELKIDDSEYYQQLVGVLQDLPGQFDYWPALVECVDMMLIKKRIDDMDMAKMVMKLLMINAMLHLSHVGATLLAVAHNILLRYPRLRHTMLIKWTQSNDSKGNKKTIVEEDDKVEDWAMQGLRNTEGKSNQAKFFHTYRREDQAVEDGSWADIILSASNDKKYQKIVEIMVHKDIRPLAFSAAEVGKDFDSILENTTTRVTPPLKSNKFAAKAKPSAKFKAKPTTKFAGKFNAKSNAKTVVQPNTKAFKSQKGSNKPQFNKSKASGGSKSNFKKGKRQ